MGTRNPFLNILMVRKSGKSWVEIGERLGKMWEENGKNGFFSPENACTHV